MGKNEDYQLRILQEEREARGLMGDRLFKLRNGRTYQEFADATGVSAHTLQRSELGGGSMRIENFIKIAETQDVSLEWLLTGQEPEGN